MFVTFNVSEVKKALRTVGWQTVEHALHTDVFIYIWPVHTFAIPDKSKVCPLRRCRFRQSPRPGERYADNTTVQQVRNDCIRCDFNVSNPRLCTSHNAHAMPP
jgi:hypothetical protein